MFNPLRAFEPKYLEAFRKKGVKAFVKQTYKRGGSGGSADAILLMHFESLLAAQQYYDVIKYDLGRELLLMESADDVARINTLLTTMPVFMTLTAPDANERARKVLDKRLKAFIEHKLNWRPGRSDEVIFDLDIQYAEIYAKLKFRSKEIKVKLEDIENASYVL
jgi:hypothetical protein